jgi:hypothetical protein
MDVLDPKEVMGHGNKVPNGPSSEQLARLFEAIFSRYSKASAIGFATIPSADEGGLSIAAVNRMIAGAVRGVKTRESRQWSYWTDLDHPVCIEVNAMVARIILISIMSSIASTAVSLAALLLSYSLFLHQEASAEDLTGVAVFSFVPSLLMCLIFYTPALRWLNKRSEELDHLKVILFDEALNVPAFIVLAVGSATGGFFGPGEAVYFALGYTVSAGLYSSMYQKWCARTTARVG